jgi:hypothetical protein
MMKKLKTRILFLFLMSGLILSLSLKHSLAAEQGEWKTIKEIEKPAEPVAQIESIARPKIEYKSDALRDPFKEIQTRGDVGRKETPGGAKAVPLPPLTVQGLIWGGNFPQAIINHKVLKVGDTIEGASITGIDKNGVAVLFNGSDYKLPSPAQTGAPVSSKKP